MTVLIRVYDPTVQKHVYHHDAETDSPPEAVAVEPFELAASVNDPSGRSFYFAIDHWR